MRARVHTAIVAALCVIVSAVWPIRAGATDYVALHLYQSVQNSDLVAVVTVVDAERAVVRVDETLKGTAPSPIQLVDYIDGFLIPAQRLLLTNGNQELMFLERRGDAFAPLQRECGRWPMRVEREKRFVAEHRKAIIQLVDLQARAARTGKDSINAYVDGLQARNPHVRLWAAHSAYAQVEKPTARLVDAYLELWTTGNGELVGSTANAVIKWRVQRAAPMLAASLQAGSEKEQAVAARALGGAGDRAFLPHLIAAAVTNSSERVRASAYEGLTYLLAGKSIPYLRDAEGSNNLRRHIAIHAFNMANRSADAELRANVRRFLQMLAENPARDLHNTAASLLSRLDSP